MVVAGRNGEGASVAAPAPPSQVTLTDLDAEVVVTEWRRYGHHRAYAARPDGSRLGFRDLLTGEDHPTTPADGTALTLAVATWLTTREADVEALSAQGLLTSDLERCDLAGPTVVAPVDGIPVAPPALPHVTLPVAPPPAPGPHGGTGPDDDPTDWLDLTLNRPGSRALARAGARRHGMARRREERRWALRARCEERVAAELEGLPRADPRWRVLHSVPTRAEDADIEHVAVGPAGVFTINSKHHLGQRLWVGGDTVMVNGRRTDYVPEARRQAGLASALLGQAAGFEVPATGVVVPLRLAEFIATTHPDDVGVVVRLQLASWLLERPPLLSDLGVETVWEHARRSTTWHA